MCVYVCVCVCLSLAWPELNWLSSLFALQMSYWWRENKRELPVFSLSPPPPFGPFSVLHHFDLGVDISDLVCLFCCVGFLFSSLSSGGAAVVCVCLHPKSNQKLAREKKKRIFMQTPFTQQRATSPLLLFAAVLILYSSSSLLWCWSSDVQMWRPMRRRRRRPCRGVAPCTLVQSHCKLKRRIALHRIASHRINGSSPANKCLFDGRSMCVYCLFYSVSPPQHQQRSVQPPQQWTCGGIRRMRRVTLRPSPPAGLSAVYCLNIDFSLLFFLSRQKKTPGLIAQHAQYIASIPHHKHRQAVCTVHHAVPYIDFMEEKKLTKHQRRRRRRYHHLFSTAVFFSSSFLSSLWFTLF